MLTPESGLGPVLLLTAGSIGVYALLALGLERRRIPVEIAPRRIAGLLWGALFGALSFGIVLALMLVTGAEATVWGIIAIMLQAGLPLALLYALTRSLWVVIAFHWAWNATQGPIVGAAVSGNESSPGIWTLNPHGPEVLSGDAFGPEGSIFPVIVLGIVAVVLAVLLVRHIAVVAPMWTRRARQRVTG